MWVSIDFCLVPLGAGVSISPYLAICQEVIAKTGLDHEIGPNGTSIEGDWDQVFSCVEACHEVIHQKGVPRIYTTLKVNTRIDRKQSFREKVPSVKAAMSLES